MANLPDWISVPVEPTEEATLLPCPFCGGKAEFERVGNRRRSTIVTCSFCGCSLESGEEDGGFPKPGTRWNERAGAAPAAPADGREASWKIELAAWLDEGCNYIESDTFPSDRDAEHWREEVAKRRGWAVFLRAKIPPGYGDGHHDMGRDVSELICYCGHALGKHDDCSNCTVPECSCSFFERDPGAPAPSAVFDYIAGNTSGEVARLEDSLEHTANALGREIEICAELRHQVESLRRAVEWRPIETAPRDGSFVLLHVPNGLESGTVTVGAYYKPDERADNGRFKKGNWDGWLGMDVDIASSWCDPTHWMPLPLAPVSDALGVG